jgi:predicted Holliday junction resolvase-like endonuclease
VDGIAFGSDQVVIVEFKTAGSHMSRRQRGIQKLVEEGKVFFREIRLEA